MSRSCRRLAGVTYYSNTCSRHLGWSRSSSRRKAKFNPERPEQSEGAAEGSSERAAELRNWNPSIITSERRQLTALLALFGVGA
jgi:hypothetical protein